MPLNDPIASPPGEHQPDFDSAQDLLHQSMAQWWINIAVVAEPYDTSTDDWVEDLNSSVALISSTATSTPPLVAIKRGRRERFA